MQNEELNIVEKELKAKSGVFMLLLNVLLFIVFVLSIIWGGIRINQDYVASGVILLVTGILYVSAIFPILLCGLKVINPNEALVLVLFGKYYGTLKKDGFYWVNPFCIGVNPTSKPAFQIEGPSISTAPQPIHSQDHTTTSKKISLKAMTLNNEKQKVNDEQGNPIIIGVVVIWKVSDTVKAVFNVDNYKTFLSTQTDSALRNVARLYPYDVSSEGDEKSLRGSSQEVSDRIKEELQSRVNIAGLEILETRITHLAYAPEIAAAMLQRQQASAIIVARQKIVEGAVGMVEMALNKLNENGVVELDEERKAAMVSNLLVVLCGNKEAQPVVNSGTIY